MTLSLFQAQFERALNAFLAQKEKELTLTQDPFLQEILTYPQKLLMGGKRIRPYMAALMFRACGGSMNAGVSRFLISLELFHLFGLIHDDIIDHGTSRHQIPTLHLHVANRLKAQKRRGDHTHIGEAQALLVGDLLFSWSLELLSQGTTFTPERQRAARAVFFRMSEEVMFGQMLDVDLTTRPTATEQLVVEKMLYKTASYTFIRPLELGAVLAGGSKKQIQFCHTVGRALGLAFQIQDDLFDLTTPSKKSKKTVLSDLAEHQHTVFTQYILDHGTTQEKAELKKLMGATLSEKDRSRVLTLFGVSGALEHGQRMVNEQLESALYALDQAPFTPAIKKEFFHLVDLIEHRTS